MREFGYTVPNMVYNHKNLFTVSDDDEEDHKFQLVECKKEPVGDDDRSLCSYDSDFDDYDDRVGKLNSIFYNLNTTPMLRKIYIGYGVFIRKGIYFLVIMFNFYQ